MSRWAKSDWSSAADCKGPVSALDRACSQTADQLLAEEREHQENRDDRKCCCAAEGAPLLAEEADIVVNGHLDVFQRIAVDHDRGGDEFVPGADEGKQGRRRKGRTDDRRDDAGDDVGLAAAVDAGRFLDLPGQAAYTGDALLWI